MMPLELHTGHLVFLAARHVVSIKANETTTGSIIRMVNGEQWAVTKSAVEVRELIDLWTKES